MRARTINGTEVPIEAKPQYIWSLPSPSLKTISIGARVHHSGGLQSALKNRRSAPDLFLPIITQGFNPGRPCASEDFSPGIWADPLPLLQHLLRHRATNRTTSLKLIPQSKLLLHRVGHQLPLHLFSKRRQALHRSTRPRKTAENT